MSELVTETSSQCCPQCKHVQTLVAKDLVFCVKCRFPVAVIGARYRCIKEIGEGGFGTVYLAQEREDPSAQYVIKVLKPETLQIAGMEKRFQREIRLTQQLSEHNEHIVKLIDFGEEQGLGHYYVMEHLDGKELFARLRARTVLSYKEIFHIFRQLCEGMAIAHRTGVIHRDLKPNNIFLVRRDNDPNFVKIIDFGIAKPLEGTANPDLTKGMLGTPYYMPPEQCANRNIDQRSDIYAMGAILFEMLTGRPPFSGDLSDILLQKMTQPPPSIRTLQPDRDFPEALDLAISKAMATQPDDRFRTAAGFWKALAPHIDVFEQELMLNGRTIDWDELDDHSLALDETGAYGTVQGIDLQSEADAATISTSQDALERVRTIGTQLPPREAESTANAAHTAEATSPTPPQPVPIQHAVRKPEATSNVILSKSILTEAPLALGSMDETPGNHPSPSKKLDPAVYVAITVALLLLAATMVLIFR